MGIKVCSHCLSPGAGKNGLYDIMQNVSHYTGTGTPLSPILLFSVPGQVPVPE